MVDYDQAGQRNLYLQSREDSTYRNDFWSDTVLGTEYFITFMRNDAGGTSNKGLLTAYIRTGSHLGTLVDTLIVNCQIQQNWRYVNAIISHDANPADTWTGNIKNLNLNETPFLPYEDFTTYTEVDPGAYHVVVPRKIITTDMPSDDTGQYVHKDFEANYFSTDFTHYFTTQLVGGVGARRGVCYQVANAIGGLDTILGTPEDIVAVSWIGLAADIRLYGWIGNSDSFANDSVGSLVEGTIYYIAVNYDYDGGVNSVGMVTYYIRTGGHNGTLIDTLVTTATDHKLSLRYMYGAATYAWTQSSNTISYSTWNLDISDTTQVVAVDSGLIQSIIAYGGMHQVILRGVILR
jgi:hypothetical protein